MRQILLIVIVTFCCGASIVSPQVGALSYVAFALSRPDILAYSALPFSMILAVMMIGSGVVRELPRIGGILTNPIVLAVFALQLVIGISVMTAVYPSLCVYGYNKYIKVVITMLAIPWLIYSEVWLRRLVFTIALSLGLIALKFAGFALVQGSVRFPKGYGGFIGDSNGLALALVMLIPICWYCRYLTQSKWLRMLFHGCTAASFMTVIFTFSRGNAIGLAVVALVLALRSRYKSFAIPGMIVLSLPALYLAGERYADRIGTLGDIQGEHSAFSRLWLAQAAVRMWLDYPIFGVGFGEDSWVALSARYLGEPNHLKVHNTYLQMLVDSGIFAFLLHIGLVWGTVVWLEMTARRTKERKPEWVAYPRMLQTSMIAYGIGSTFYSRGDFEFFYILLMTSAAWYTVYVTEVLNAAPVRTAPVPATPISQSPPGPAPPRLPVTPEPVAARRNPVWANRHPRGVPGR